jgi:hypothetical protein
VDASIVGRDKSRPEEGGAAISERVAAIQSYGR